MADSREKAQKIVKRRRKSLENYAPIHDECAEVYQAVQCRTNPIYKKNKDGSDSTVIDDTRTNVSMPILSIMTRKNSSRMTASPPQLDYIGGSPDVSAKLTGWHYMQYDLTNEGETRRKTVMQSEMFGAGVEKIFEDNVVLRRKLRVPTAKATRSQVLQYQKTPDVDMQAQIQSMGEQLQPEEVSQHLATIGPEFELEQEVKRYSGPVCKSIFLGDIHLPPGCDNLDNAEWIIEEYVESPTFFEYWLQQTYTDSEGNEVPVFDQKAVDELLDGDKELPDDEKTSLRDRFKQFNKLDTTHQYDKELACSKKFKIYECHEKRDGKNWICWVGNENHYLGEMPYPWDFYGQWAYTALVPLPNQVIWIGDSTPRLGRYLYRMLNVNEGQKQDLITNFMKPFVITRLTADIPDEATDRGTFRELKVQNPNDVKMEQMPQLPQYAWEQTSFILRMFGLLDPASTSADLAGTNSNPGQGKTATVGVLAQRERDSLTQYKVDGMNIFLKKVGQKKLWMLQKTMQQPVSIPGKYFSEEGMTSMGQEAVSMRGGQATVITMDWPEIQEDLQVEPKAGSTLSIEDEFHRMGSQTLFQMAQSSPEVIDIFYAAKAYVDTLPGVDSNKAIKQPAPPPDPVSAIKMSLSVNMPLDKMPADVTNQALQKLGFEPSAELVHRDTIEGVKSIGEAADAAGKLEEPAVPPVKPDGEGSLRKTAADRA